MCVGARLDAMSQLDSHSLSTPTDHHFRQGRIERSQATERKVGMGLDVSHIGCVCPSTQSHHQLVCRCSALPRCAVFSQCGRVADALFILRFCAGGGWLGNGEADFAVSSHESISTELTTDALLVRRNDGQRRRKSTRRMAGNGRSQQRIDGDSTHHSGSECVDHNSPREPSTTSSHFLAMVRLDCTPPGRLPRDIVRSLSSPILLQCG